MNLPIPPNVPNPSERSGRHCDPMHDLRRRLHGRIAERIDPVRNRYKPLSLLRREATRVIEQYFDSECPLLTRSERDGLITEIIAGAPGVGPLEELFRDTAVCEILILSGGSVIVRKGDDWVPTNAGFRTQTELRAMLTRFADVGQPLADPGGTTTAGFDVRLTNGFRVMAVVPPSGLDFPPTVLFVREIPTDTAAPNSGSSATSFPPARPVGPPKATADSSVVTIPAPRSGIHPAGSLSSLSNASGRYVDPVERIRLRVTERIIAALSAAGIYDITLLPTADLRKLVLAHVNEANAAYRLGLDGPAQNRLAAEILAGMSR